MTTDREGAFGSHAALASQAFGVLEGVLDQQLKRHTGGARLNMVRFNRAL